MSTSDLVVWSATYDSFGNADIGIQGITNNLRFPGQYYDAETGLHYNLNRYYDPATGRYLRPDPYGQGLNLYAYCFNNPLTLIDPRGLCVVKGAAKAAFEMVYQSLAMVYDLEQIAYSLITGDLDAYAPASAIGQVVEAGAGTGDILTGMLVGLVDVPVEFGLAIWAGDPERIGGASFNLAVLLYGAGKTGGSVKGYISNLRNLRLAYSTKVHAISEIASGLLERGVSKELVAHIAHQMRRNLGISYKTATPFALRQLTYVRNIIKYDTKLGPSFKWLIEQGRTYDAIIESASRYNPFINKVLRISLDG